MSPATEAEVAARRVEEAVLLLADVYDIVSLPQVRAAREACELAAALVHAAAMAVRSGQ